MKGLSGMRKVWGSTRFSTAPTCPWATAELLHNPCGIARQNWAPAQPQLDGVSPGTGPAAAPACPAVAAQSQRASGTGSLPVPALLAVGGLRSHSDKAFFKTPSPFPLLAGGLWAGAVVGASQE